MRTTILAGLLATVTLPALAVTANADQFSRIATYHVEANLPADADRSKETVAEIIAATPDGNLLVHTDSPGKRLGLVDITDPAAPKAAGTVALGGEPTSVVVAGGKAIVGVVTSDKKSEPGGHVAVVDLASRKVEATCDLGGQPDSLALSPDGSYIAIAIENERDEEINDGAIPQLPAGNLTIFTQKDGAFDCSSRRVVDLTGIAEVAPEDPEPEFVDINSRNEVVVTMQENNHIAIVDLASGKVVSHFSAGSLNVSGVDTEKDGVISLTGEMKNVPREPDAVKWVDDERIVTANEGDWKGGTRDFSIFGRDGKVLYTAGTDLEYLAVRLGHYPEKRNKKGVEIEGVATGRFGADKLIFAASERASLVGVYRDAGANPEFLQALPGGVGPEGVLTIPSRNLLVTASENDARADGGVGSVVTVYRYGAEPSNYPGIESANDASGKPIPWGALSGFVADKEQAGRIYAVSDSAYSQARIFTIDATRTPAVITDAITVTRDGKAAEKLDLEGIALAADGGFWLASEGNPEGKKGPTANQLIKVSRAGVIENTVELPADLASQATRFGFEGVTVSGAGADETVWVAVQREWKDDPKGLVKLLAYKPATGNWAKVHYPLEKVEAGWAGISEITADKDGLVIVERDNQIGPAAKLKVLTRVDLAGVTPVALTETSVPVVKKKIIRDLLPDLRLGHGYVQDKIESLAIFANGDAFAVTDNDGVDGSSGETRFLRLGRLAD